MKPVEQRQTKTKKNKKQWKTEVSFFTFKWFIFYFWFFDKFGSKKMSISNKFPFRTDCCIWELFYWHDTSEICSWVYLTILVSPFCLPPGGTDIIACFMGTNWTLPVYRGEIQSMHLGCDMQSWDEMGECVMKAHYEQLDTLMYLVCEP